MIIALIGMRGVGKTTVGRELARRLHKPFVDLDALIEERMQRSVPQIFTQFGEMGFRAAEKQALEKALEGDDVVLACGGGVVETPENRALLRKCRVVLLETEVGTLAERVKESDRPALTTQETEQEIRALLLRRQPLFKKLADVRVRCNGAGIEEICKRIEREVKNHEAV